jgi:hypothetical protein
MAASLYALGRVFELTQVDHAYTRTLELGTKRIHLWTIG